MDQSPDQLEPLSQSPYKSNNDENVGTYSADASTLSNRQQPLDGEPSFSDLATDWIEDCR